MFGGGGIAFMSYAMWVGDGCGRSNMYVCGGVWVGVGVGGGEGGGGGGGGGGGVGWGGVVEGEYVNKWPLVWANDSIS